ncbi:MAG: hypothetical protein KJ944_11730 [Alphaproteobacteria bacterium]|nr:hypothetical protein [Alphaproteobacteria bacterium]MBU1560093.1 hypothetical protein [Alphaproteobacteria bacterium]MBU2303255.1 hypothetical protein [Alphaproteobacteria bacterium]MBU2366142.1 hypothetical protein [Alphaproteobacteria bacterium]
MEQAGPVHPGLVGHALLTPSVQVQILSVVDATGSASIGDIIAELPGHTDPVGAVFALITAGVLAVLTTGIIDANTIVARADNGGPQGGADTPVPEARPSDGLTENLTSDAGALPASFAEFSASTLPHELDVVPVSQLHPRIIVGSGERRSGFRRVDCLSRPGVYILLRGSVAYVGYGANVGARIMNGRQMPGGTPDCVIAIVDEHDGLSTDDARALERILWSWVSNDDDFDLVNGVPDGAPIEPHRYDQLTLLCAHVALALRQAGLMFLGGSVREHIAGPRTEPDRLGAPRRIDDLPDGRVMELSYCGLTALAADREDGTWLLLRGSDVRIDTVASANASASFQRAAWLHGGLLEPARDGSCYVLKRDIVFSSGSAVSHFVSGSKGFGLSAWQPIDEDDAELPEPAL